MRRLGLAVALGAVLLPASALAESPEATRLLCALSTALGPDGSWAPLAETDDARLRIEIVDGDAQSCAGRVLASAAAEITGIDFADLDYRCLGSMSDPRSHVLTAARGDTAVSLMIDAESFLYISAGASEAGPYAGSCALEEP